MKTNSPARTILLRTALALILGTAVTSAVAQINALSSRANVGTQENVVVTEFVLQGSVAKDIYVRGEDNSVGTALVEVYVLK